MPIRILIAEDQRIVREGIIALLEDDDGVEIVGEAANGEQALEAWTRLRPDVVLMDLQMPVVDGAEATRRIREIDPDARILVLTTYATDEFIWKALRSGAKGYLLKDASADELLDAIATVSSGGTTLAPSVAARLVAGVSGDRPEPLTPRELEVLALLVHGRSNQAIADELVVAVGTVKRHVNSILGKLQAQSRLEAVTRARDLGLVELPG